MKQNNDFHFELAHIIKYHRKRGKLSQNELASLAGVGKTVVHNIEHAKKSVQLNTLLSILKVLNIHLAPESPLMDEYLAARDDSNA